MELKDALWSLAKKAKVDTMSKLAERVGCDHSPLYKVMGSRGVLSLNCAMALLTISGRPEAETLLFDQVNRLLKIIPISNYARESAAKAAVAEILKTEFPEIRKK